MLSMLCEHYRVLHALAETSNQEFQTASYLRSCLRVLNVPYDAIGTHTIAYLKTQKKESKELWVVYRCDCDAIMVGDRVMHACGHDGHMSIALELCSRLLEESRVFKHSCMVLFQASEERVEGAKQLLPFLSSFDIACVIGIHILPFVEKRKWYCKAGTFFVGSQEVDLVFHGMGGHAASPENCDDLLLEMSLSIVSIQSHFARKFRKHLISFGLIMMDGVRNVLPSDVIVEGTLRIYEEEDRKAILELLKSVLPTCGRVVLHNATASVLNDERLLSMFPYPYESANTLGFADDFGEYSHRYPSLYLGFGGGQGGLHTREFVVDCDALEVAVKELLDFLFVLDENLSYNSLEVML